MKHFNNAGLLGVALTALLSVQVDAQNVYADCSTNYTVLEKALLETSDNMFRLSTTYFHPDVENPLYVDVYYKYSNSSVKSHYIWSAATLYFIIQPPALVYLSQFYSHIHENRIVELSLQLPADCAELASHTSSEKENFLFVLTQRLRLYAKYYHSINNLVLPQGFEARISSYEQKERFINDDGVIIFFTFMLSLPFAVCAIFVCYVRGIRKRLKVLLEKSEHHSSQAALVCVGLTYSLFVAFMDTKAVSSKGILATYMKVIVIIMCIVEYLFILLIVIIVLILCCESICCSPSKFCKVKLWFVTVGVLPPLVCLSSHIGIVIQGWASVSNHGTAMMLFYSISFIFLFVSFKKMYLVMEDLKKRKSQQRFKIPRTTESPDENELQSCKTCKETTPENASLLSSTLSSSDPASQEEVSDTNRNSNDTHTNSATPGKVGDEKDSPGLDFCVLLFEMFIGIPITGGTLVYVAAGFTKFPVLQGTDDAITYMYNFGQIAFIFVVFLLTYTAIHSTSSGIVSEHVIKFWEYFHNGKKSAEDLLEELCIESDTDKANALSAVLIFRIIHGAKGKGEVDHCSKLLSKIVRSESKDDKTQKSQSHKEEVKQSDV